MWPGGLGEEEYLEGLFFSFCGLLLAVLDRCVQELGVLEDALQMRLGPVEVSGVEKVDRQEGVQPGFSVENIRKARES